jgi:hypothetical protein
MIRHEMMASITARFAYERNCHFLFHFRVGRSVGNDLLPLL